MSRKESRVQLVKNMDIEIKNISKKYGDKDILKNLNIILKEGQCNVLMGPSGCGKTTLLQIIMESIKPDTGTVTGMPKHISAVFQENRLCEDFSAVINVAMVLKGRNREEEIRENLKKTGLEGSLDQPVRELSGGMKRRVALVRAVMAESEFVVLDEPFKGLDEETREMVMKYFLEGTKGRTVLAVTHDKKEAEFLAGGKNIWTLQKEN